ncbi:hypothetical protein [Oleisolibacter albus]|uniref:hypothetical protein n=1 Tax=Oleisolibacter albus TaxID=2171757 RepID=UPI0012D7EFBC|nr:hypothetical protein [Oleisolibacter albus]
MSLFISLGKGPKLFIEVARWAEAPRGLQVRRENGEVLFWLGRVHLIYTPARWRPAVRGPTFDGRTSNGRSLAT